MSGFILLWLLPIVVAIISRRRARENMWRNIGFTFGLVVSPASTGLYSLYFVGPIVAILGMLGLVLALVHGWLGYVLAVKFGFVPEKTVIQDAMHLPIEVINGTVWSVAYGLVGCAIDALRKSKRSGRASPYSK